MDERQQEEQPELLSVGPLHRETFLRRLARAVEHHKPEVVAAGAVVLIAAAIAAGVLAGPTGNGKAVTLVQGKGQGEKAGYHLTMGAASFVADEEALSLRSSDFPPSWKTVTANPEIPVGKLLAGGSRSGPVKAFVSCMHMPQSLAATVGATGMIGGLGGLIGYHTSPNFVAPPGQGYAQASSVASVQASSRTSVRETELLRSARYGGCSAGLLASAMSASPEAGREPATSSGTAGSQPGAASTSTSVRNITLPIGVKVTSVQQVPLPPLASGVSGVSYQYVMAFSEGSLFTMQYYATMIMLFDGRFTVSLFLAGSGQPFPASLMVHLVMLEGGALAQVAARANAGSAHTGAKDATGAHTGSRGSAVAHGRVKRS
ncbi:MAG: hypothetical protein M1399_08350 [Actinobacteria bacterium]|nr:hypothetical protein [Actinomycetota bacterium]MCL5446854.1 hypothetical protein [Actinomycetota bacterium]